MKPPQFKLEKIAIADLPEYLERHKLRVMKVELWRKRGLIVYTEQQQPEPLDSRREVW